MMRLYKVLKSWPAILRKIFLIFFTGILIFMAKISKFCSNCSCLLPSIIEIETENHKEYFVTFEKHMISQKSHQSFLEAFKVCFSLYFVLNIMYPKSICTTLEMIQRYFFKIQPDSKSKSKKMTVSKKKFLI